MNLFANPLIPIPSISEFFYNDGNWQIEIYFFSDYPGYEGITGFQDLRLNCNAGNSGFITGLPFSYDSIMVIDQSMLSSQIEIDPIQDNIGIEISDGSGGWYGGGIGIWYGPTPTRHSTTGPGPNQSLCNQFIYINGERENWEQVKQSPPTIGSDEFNTTTRVSFSGYIFDQYLQPLEGFQLRHCWETYCSGITVPVFSCFETNENGYFETDGLFSNLHCIDIRHNYTTYDQDTIFFEPDSVYYKEYILNIVGLLENYVDERDDYFDLSILPNPNQGEYDINIYSETEHYYEARIDIYSANGILTNSRNIALLEKGKNTYRFNNSSNRLAQNGLYICTLTIENEVKSSTKMLIIND